MASTSELLRGHTDAILLAQLAGGDSYGYLLNRRVAELTGGALEFKEATLYTAFRRLEEGGLISSYWGEEGAGARRRYYALTSAGWSALGEDREQWREIRDTLDRLLAPRPGETPPPEEPEGEKTQTGEEELV